MSGRQVRARAGRVGLGLVAALVAVLAIALAGCGGGSNGSETETAPSSTAEAPGSAPSKPQQGGEAGSPSKPQGAGESGQGKESGSGAPEEESASPPAGTPQHENPERSLETFGSNAEGAARAKVLAAMRTYFGDIASGNFNHICSTLLTKGNREQLQAYLNASANGAKSCPELLQSVLKTQAKKARAAAAGSVQRVRMEGGNAIIIFTPSGGQKSYFTMTEESGSWRVISLTTGTPMNPLGK